MYGIVPSVNHKETWNQWGICYIKQLNAVIQLRNDLSECVCVCIYECVGSSIDYDVQEGSVGWPPQDLGLSCYVPTTAMKSIQLLIRGDHQCRCSCTLMWIRLKIQLEMMYFKMPSYYLQDNLREKEYILSMCTLKNKGFKGGFCSAATEEPRLGSPKNLSVNHFIIQSFKNTFSTIKILKCPAWNLWFQ